MTLVFSSTIFFSFACIYSWSIGPFTIAYMGEGWGTGDWGSAVLRTVPLRVASNGDVTTSSISDLSIYYLHRMEISYIKLLAFFRT